MTERAGDAKGRRPVWDFAYRTSTPRPTALLPRQRRKEAPPTLLAWLRTTSANGSPGKKPCGMPAKTRTGGGTRRVGRQTAPRQRQRPPKRKLIGSSGVLRCSPKSPAMLAGGSGACAQKALDAQRVSTIRQPVGEGACRCAARRSRPAARCPRCCR